MRSLSLAASGLAFAFAPLGALASGTLVFSDQKAEAGVRHQLGPSLVGNAGLTQSFAGTDFVATQNRVYNASVFSGRGYAHHGATFLTPGSVIGAPFSGAILDACTSAEIYTSGIGPYVYEEAYGMANGVIEFTLSAPMNWSWIGGWQGNTHNTGSYNEVLAVHELIEVGSGFNHVNQTRSSVNGAGNWVEFFSRGGSLGPGTYRLTWSHESYVLGGHTPYGFFPTGYGGAPLVSCINSEFRIWNIPAPGSLALLGMGGLFATRRRR
ncbi:MAG: PEP-CTERM sorting domain-containing protein [Phycisphaeraceae bacterium]|nr:PEP-CTERM sorting domain-containing protein [Phycisphaeraceae bacterium]